jgi:hypothetical protein
MAAGMPIAHCAMRSHALGSNGDGSTGEDAGHPRHQPSEDVMKKSMLMVATLLTFATAGSARAADLITAPLLAHQNDLVTCQVINVGKTAVDLKVDLIDPATGSIFGPAVCAGTGTGGTCVLALGVGADRLVYCRVSPAQKKNVRAALQINGGAAAVAQ